MSSKTRVGIIFGGKSAEHEVSLQSARNIVDALDKERYEAVLIGIDKQGQWHVNDASNYLLHAEDPALIALNRSNVEVALVPGKQERQLVGAGGAAPAGQIDVIFPIVHGTLGGTARCRACCAWPICLSSAPDVLGSALCMDKAMTKRVLRGRRPGRGAVRILYPRHRRARPLRRAGRPSRPGAVRQAGQHGILRGREQVRNEAEFTQAMALALQFDHKVLVEQAIVGREIECAVLGNDDPQASVCGEIVLRDEFYSYDTKYIDEDGAAVVVPADISAQASETIRGVALDAFRALECAGLAQVDVFLTSDGRSHRQRGQHPARLHPHQHVPQAVAGQRHELPELVTRLIELARERHARDAMLKTSIR